MRHLYDEIERLIEIEKSCEETPHRCLVELPLDFISNSTHVELANQPHETLFVWHRDLCWQVAKLSEFDIAPNLESACYRLATAIGEVPRDTVYTYAARAFASAPATFSGLKQETHFVHGLQRASKCLLLLTKLAARLSRDDPKDIEVDLLVANTLTLNRILSDVVKFVDISTFVTDIEPHFKRRTVLGQKYYGPTAAQLPLVSFEALLYGHSASENLKSHINFQRSYLPRALRMVVDAALASPPLLFETIGPAASRKIELHINRFRRVHIAIARKAFALQSTPSDKAKVILENLLNHNSRNHVDE